MGHKWIHAIKGVISTLHQVLMRQSPDGLYTINVKRDTTQHHKYFNVNTRGKIKRMTEDHIKWLEKGKAKVEEEFPEDETK